MSATYTDRYVAAVVRHLPADQHADVEAELRSSIADAVDGGADEATVLNDMGDPERLAATYADRPLQLIGPRLYLQWKRLLVLLLWIVVPIVAAATALGSVLADDGSWAIIGQTLGAAWITLIMLCFWVTAVFAAMERWGGSEIDEIDTPWTVDKLPEPTTANVTWGETASSAAVIVLTAALLVWQQLFPWVQPDAGEPLPIINPDLWSFVLPALLAVMLVELVVVIMRQVRGHWTMADWWVTLGINVATVALLLPPLLDHTFLNRAAFEAMGWPDAAAPFGLETTELIIAGVIVIVAVSDVVGGFLKARRSR
jgi:hypothetical protein